MKDYLEKIYSLLKLPNQDSINLSMADTHHPDIFSLVIDGTEFGKLTRVFISGCKLRPFDVQLHTHRYPIRLTVIKGTVMQITATEAPEAVDTVTLSKYSYKSPLNGGDGLAYVGETDVLIQQHYTPVGGSIYMGVDDFHTMACSKGSMWIVEEGGFKNDSSLVLGVPFVTDGLYNAPKPFQLNDKIQLVAKEVKKILNDYKSV